MEALIESHNTVLKLNTNLLLNCFSDIDDETAQKRLSEGTNNMVFIACHLVDARYYLAGTLGLDSDYPFKELLRDARSIDDIRVFPSVESVLTSWTVSAERLQSRLAFLSVDDLAEQIELPIPVEERTVGGLLTFLMQHESFHIGQLAILRKSLGRGAMSYQVETN